MSPRALDLFCGAGGLSCGLLQAGYDVVAGVEFDPVAHATFLRNHPRRFTLRDVDIRKLGAEDILRQTGLDSGEIDLVVGGPPCQGFSTAGYRKRTDERNSLVWEFIRLVGELRPPHFAMENVVGLLSMQWQGRTTVLSEIDRRFRDLGYATNIGGERADPRRLIVNAAEYGVPQRRRRVLVFGARGDMDQVPRLREATHFDPNAPSLFGGRAPFVTVSEALDDLPAPTESGTARLERKTGISAFARSMRGECVEVENHGLTRHRPWMITRMRKQRPGQPLYDTWAHAWVRLEADQPSPTVKENHNAPFVHHEQPRVLSPRECARLQSFPDGFVFCGPKSKQLVQIGNAVPPLLGREIGLAVRRAVNAGGEESDAEVGAWPWQSDRGALA
jgi:DNA (cytosine-5)-methyltransferase 1